MPERDGPRFLLTIKLLQWNVLAYKLTDVDCPICYYKGIRVITYNIILLLAERVLLGDY